MRKAGKTKETRGVWRIHSAFDLPSERFGFFELTDEHGGETIDRVPVVKGEIRVGDRAFLQPDRIATVIEAGADIVVHHRRATPRSGYKAWGASNLRQVRVKARG